MECFNEFGLWCVAQQPQEGRYFYIGLYQAFGSLPGSGGSSFTFGGVISGSGTLTKSGGGTLTLTGANTFTGGVTINSPGSTTPSVLTVKHSNALGAGPKTVTLAGYGRALKLDGSSGPVTLAADISFNTSNNGTDNGGTSPAIAPIINVAGNNTINGDISLTSGGSGTLIQCDAGTLTLTGGISAIATGRSIEFTGNGYITVSGVISNGATTALPLTKSGNGTLTLTAANTFTGTTNVSTGTLAVNGSHAGTLSVASTAELAGDGTISAATTINGRHSPGGSAVAILTHSGSLAYGTTSRVAWQLKSHVAGGGSGTAYDRVAAQAVTVAAGARIDITLNAAGSVVNFSDAFWDTAKSWNILTHTNRTGAFALGSITPDAGGRIHANHGTFSLTQTATATSLTWTPYTALESWRLQHFGTTANTGNAADLADANNDGEMNMLEFATGQVPTANTRVNATLTPDGTNLDFTYTRANAAVNEGITFTVEWSDTLAAGSWSNAGVIQQIQSDNGTVQTLKATVSSGAGKRFLRLKVAGTP